MPVAKSKRATKSAPSKKEVLLEVNGLKIKPGAIYKITGKEDSTAPDGFQQEGVTKLPSQGIANDIQCLFVTTNNVTKDGIYDTGLYINSPCYAGLPNNVRTERVRALEEALVEPYEMVFGEGTLDHKHTDFWENYFVSLFDGRVFDTSKPSDLLDLYIAMRSYELHPAGEDGKPVRGHKYKQAQYCIEDRNKVMGVRKRKAVEEMDAIMLFGELMKSDKNRLLSILKYSGMRNMDGVDDVTLKAFFFDWLRQDRNNLHRFMSAYNLAQGEGLAEIELHEILYKLMLQNKVRKQEGMFTYNGYTMDSTLTASAKRIAKDPDMASLKLELFELKL